MKITTVAIGTHGPADSTPTAKRSPTQPAASITRSPIPRRCRGSIKRRPAAWPGRWSSSAKAGFQPQIALSARDAAGHRQVAAADHRLRADHASRRIRWSKCRSSRPCPAGKDEQHDPGRLDLGLGKAVAFTTDAGSAGPRSWTDWDNYDKFFEPDGPLVDAAGRRARASSPSPPTSQDGKVRVVVTALDKDDEFLNFLNMGGTVVGPDMKPLDLRIKQTAPGRYVGEFDAKDRRAATS